ncbi:ClbS/DfsB family four-helix bundle protein [Chloroflexota bacterium]
MAKKELLIDLLRQAHDKEVSFVNELSEEERKRVGKSDDWSAKDITTHNAVWKGRLAENIRLARSGSTPTRNDDYHHENDLIFQEYKNLSWTEVMSMASENVKQLVSQAEALGEDGLVRCDLLPWQEDTPIWRSIVGNGYSHPLVHISWFLQNRGDLHEAGELTGEMARAMAGLDDDPVWQGSTIYNMACYYSLMGDKARAITELSKALKLNPELKEWSKEDQDLDPIREEPDFLAIYED